MSTMQTRAHTYTAYKMATLGVGPIFVLCIFFLENRNDLFSFSLLYCGKSTNGRQKKHTHTRTYTDRNETKTKWREEEQN